MFGFKGGVRHLSGLAGLRATAATRPRLRPGVCGISAACRAGPALPASACETTCLISLVLSSLHTSTQASRMLEIF